MSTLALFITCSKCRWKSANGNLGRFPFNKNSGSKFRKFHLPNGTVHSGCTDSTQATARLVIVLVSRIQKRGTGDNILSNGQGHFGPTNWNDQTSQSGPPSKLIPNIPVGPNRNGPFHLMYQPNFPEFWVEWKAPLVYIILINILVCVACAWNEYGLKKKLDARALFFL